MFSCLPDCQHPIVGKNNYPMGRDVDHCNMVLDEETVYNEGHFQVLSNSLNMESV